MFRGINSAIWDHISGVIVPFRGLEVGSHQSDWHAGSVIWIMVALGLFLVAVFGACGVGVWQAAISFQKSLERALQVAMQQSSERELDQNVATLIFLGNLNPSDIEGAYDLPPRTFGTAKA